MKLKVLLTCLALLLAAGCQQKEEEAKIPKMLNVELAVNPEQGNVNEPVTFQVAVTYGEDPVQDPDDISLEIWRANSESHEKIIPKEKSDGIYEVDKSFDKEGTYYVYAHVTARDMHNMPKKEFVIGAPSKPEKKVRTKLMEQPDDEKEEK